MNANNLLILAKNKARSAILFGLFLGAVSFFILIATQKSFRSDLDLLVVQNQPGATDYYTLSRSTDYLAGVIIESVYSEKFLSEVNATGKISASFLPEKTEDKLKEWQKTIRINKNPDAGILNVEIFGESARLAAEISDAAADVLINKNSLFLGKGQDLEIRILSGPIVKKNPSVSQIALASGGGLAVGIILSLMFAVYKKEYSRENKKPAVRGSFEITPEHLPKDSDYWEKRLEEYRG